MPGFKISKFGGNSSAADHEARFYASFTWEIPNLFVEDYSNYSPGEDPEGSSKSKQYKGALPSSILLKTAQLPSVSFEQVKAKGGSIEYKFAGKPTFDPIKITFYDTEDLTPYLVRWSESIWSEYYGLRAANRYKKNSTITKYLIDREDSSSAIKDEFGPKADGNIRYELSGSWPMVIKESDLTYVEAGIKTVDLTIMYDHFRIVT